MWPRPSCARLSRPFTGEIRWRWTARPDLGLVAALLAGGDGGRRSPEAKPRIVAKREPRLSAGRGLGNPQVGEEGLCYEGSASQTYGACQRFLMERRPY